MIKLIPILCLCISFTYGMDCSFGTSDNPLEKFIKTCPRPIIDSSDQQYCCPDEGNSMKCCVLSSFIFEWLLTFWPVLLLAVIGFLIICCVCCCLRQIKSLCC